MLMTSAGVAMKSACHGIEVNDGQLVTTRASRRMSSALARTLRCASVCDIGTGAAAGTTKVGTVLYATTPDGTLSAYVYDPVADQLLLDTHPAAPIADTPDLNNLHSRMQGDNPTVSVMASNVTSLVFRGRYDNRPDPANPATNIATLVNVQISMEITQGEQVQRMCESVVPRRSVQ